MIDTDLISRKDAIEIAKARLRDVPEHIDLETDRNAFAAGYLAAAGSIKAALERTRVSAASTAPVVDKHAHRWVGRGEYGGTAAGYMCADCGMDADDMDETAAASPAAPAVPQTVLDHVTDKAIGCRNCGDTWEREVTPDGMVAPCEDCGDAAYSLIAAPAAPQEDAQPTKEDIREAASLIRIWMYRNDFDADKCAREVFDLFQRQQCSGEFFWVLERVENDQSAGYWNGLNSRSFVSDIDAAVQFRRREDALPIKSSWHWQDVEITEHAYVDAGSCSAPTPSQPARDAAQEIARRCVRSFDESFSYQASHADVLAIIERHAQAIISRYFPAAETVGERCAHNVPVGWGCHYCPDTIATTRSLK